MNLSFSLEKASSFSPVPVPAMLVVLEPAVADEAVVGSGAAAASASLRLSLIAGDAGKPVQMLDKREEEKAGLDFSFAAVTDACQRRGARLVQMTESTQTVWAAAGSAWVNISWGPEWIGQLAEFRTKLLTHCLNSRLASQSRDKMIIYYSHTAQAENLSTA